jgi:hypothetical protein
MNELWCLHVIGPDDLYAAPSKEEAERAASELNAWAEKIFGGSPIRPRCEAILWPHDSDGHAESAAEWEELWVKRP